MHCPGCITPSPSSLKHTVLALNSPTCCAAVCYAVLCLFVLLCCCCNLACAAAVPWLVLVLHLQAASDVYSPVSGEVVEINSALVDEPAKVRRQQQLHGGDRMSLCCGSRNSGGLWSGVCVWGGLWARVCVGGGVLVGMGILVGAGGWLVVVRGLVGYTALVDEPPKVRREQQGGVNRGGLSVAGKGLVAT
jgi:hypothetical protein